MSGIVGFL